MSSIGFPHHTSAIDEVGNTKLKQDSILPALIRPVSRTRAALYGALTISSPVLRDPLRREVESESVGCMPRVMRPRATLWRRLDDMKWEEYDGMDLLLFTPLHVVGYVPQKYICRGAIRECY